MLETNGALSSGVALHTAPLIASRVRLACTDAKAITMKKSIDASGDRVAQINEKRQVAFYLE